jgi:hypothetical protein
MRYLNFKGSYFPEENSKPAYLKENIINFFLWQTVEKNGKAQYYISDIDNFSASVAANLQQFDFEDFIKSIGHLQEFFSLHLCEKVYFPFNSDTLPLCEELGFGKTDSGSPKDIELSPLGYNLLYKQLRPPLDLFSEK